jgi:hypothetical protein
VTNYRDDNGRVIYVGRTYWGVGKYGCFYRDDLEHRLVNPALPPRNDYKSAQNDLDAFAKKNNWEKSED